MPYQPTDPRPIAATIAVLVRDTQVLLVRRANPPDAGHWGFPGGKVHQGEPLFDAAIRELAEETGVAAEPLRVITALDAFDHAPAGVLRRHFILVAVLCRWTAGDPVAADDALEARWIEIAALKEGYLALSRDVAELAGHAAALMAEVSA